MTSNDVAEAMSCAASLCPVPLRVLCLEDNPLIAFHLEQMVEDFGHRFVAAVESFSDLQASFDTLEVDCALVDIDLADGRTGPDAAAWLSSRGVAVIFVTGQEQLAQDHGHHSAGFVSKPVRPEALRCALDKLGSTRQA